jgi:hypothetical protein
MKKKKKNREFKEEMKELRENKNKRQTHV